MVKNKKPDSVEKIIDSVGEYEITENKNKAHAADSINDLSQKCAFSA